MEKEEGKVKVTIHLPLLSKKEATRWALFVQWMESQGTQCRQLPNGSYQVAFPVRDMVTCRNCGAQDKIKEFTEKRRGVPYLKCPYCHSYNAAPN